MVQKRGACARLNLCLTLRMCEEQVTVGSEASTCDGASRQNERGDANKPKYGSAAGSDTEYIGLRGAVTSRIWSLISVKGRGRGVEGEAMVCALLSNDVANTTRFIACTEHMHFLIRRLHAHHPHHVTSILLSLELGTSRRNIGFTR